MCRNGHHDVAAFGRRHADHTTYGSRTPRKDGVSTVIERGSIHLYAEVGSLLVEDARHACGIVERRRVGCVCAGFTKIRCQAEHAALQRLDGTLRYACMRRHALSEVAGCISLLERLVRAQSGARGASGICGAVALGVGRGEVVVRLRVLGKGL